MVVNRCKVETFGCNSRGHFLRESVPWSIKMEPFNLTSYNEKSNWHGVFTLWKLYVSSFQPYLKLILDQGWHVIHIAWSGHKWTWVLLAAYSQKEHWKVLWAWWNNVLPFSLIWLPCWNVLEYNVLIRNMTLSTYLLHKRSESNYPFIPQYLDTALNKIIIIIIKKRITFFLKCNF